MLKNMFYFLLKLFFDRLKVNQRNKIKKNNVIRLEKCFLIRKKICIIGGNHAKVLHNEFVFRYFHFNMRKKI